MYSVFRKMKDLTTLQYLYIVIQHHLLPDNLTLCFRSLDGINSTLKTDLIIPDIIMVRHSLLHVHVYIIQRASRNYKTTPITMCLSIRTVGQFQS